jgi:Protein of unknown function (DUF4231)
MGGAKKAKDSRELREAFSEIIDGLVLGDLQKRFLHDRWLDQVRWFESKSASNQRRYYVLRLAIIVGGVVVPALVSLNIHRNTVAQTLAWITFSISLVVALSAALDGFFGYGERWRMFRRTAEALKAHGWQFFELTGPYAGADHATAFPAFAAQVEALVQHDVEAFIAQAAQAQRLGRGQVSRPE